MSAAVLTPPGQAATGPNLKRADPKTDATKYWAQNMRSVVGPLLKLTGSYAPHEQDAHQRFLDSHVAPVLGPVPTDPHGVYTLPYAGSPVEFTVTSTSGDRPKTHITFEPERPSEPTGDDPLGLAYVREVMRRLASSVGADTRWMECLMSSLHLTPEENDAVKSFIPPFVPSGYVSFVFDGPKKVMKAYFQPILKARATKQASTAVALDAIRQLQPLGDSLAPSIDLIEEYLNSGSNGIQLSFVAIDCIDPKEARVKVYLVAQNNSWDVLQDLMTLGGRLRDEQTLESLETLRPIYPLLRDEAGVQRDDAWSKPERVPGTQFFGLQVSFELGYRREVPEMKLYVPLFQYARSKQVAQGNYQKALQKMGLDWGRGNKFEESMDTIFGDKMTGGMGIISYAYSKKKGVYTSFYVATPTENEQQEWGPMSIDDARNAEKLLRGTSKLHKDVS